MKFWTQLQSATPMKKLGNETVYDKLSAYIKHIVRH